MIKNTTFAFPDDIESILVDLLQVISLTDDVTDIGEYDLLSRELYESMIDDTVYLRMNLLQRLNEYTSIRRELMDEDVKKADELV